MNLMDAGGAALLTGYSVIIDAECDKSQSWLLELKMKKMGLLSVKPAHSGKKTFCSTSPETTLTEANHARVTSCNLSTSLQTQLELEDKLRPCPCPGRWQL